MKPQCIQVPFKNVVLQWNLREQTVTFWQPSLPQEIEIMKWLARQQILAKLNKLWTSASTALAPRLGNSPGENQPLRGGTLTLTLTTGNWNISENKHIHTDLLSWLLFCQQLRIYFRVGQAPYIQNMSLKWWRTLFFTCCLTTMRRCTSM